MDLRLRSLIYFLLLFAFIGTPQVSVAAPFCRGALQSPTGPEVKLLIDPKESFAMKLAALRSAQKSIDISYYIFSNDSSGKLLLAELQAAVHRGVKVRLLVDDYGSRKRREKDFRELYLESPDLQGLIDPSRIGGVELVLINPHKRYGQAFKQLMSMILRRPMDHSQISVNNRSHDKIIIVDSHLAILGGRNVGNLYSNLGSHEGRASEDFEVAIRDLDGKAISQLLLHFEVLYTHADNLVLSKPTQARPSSLISEARQILKEEGLDEKVQELLLSDFGGGFKPSPVEFVSDIRNLVKSHEILEGELWSMNSTRRSIIQRLLEAKSSAQVVTPFLILSPRDISRLGKFLRANPQVRFDFYTNSINSDSVFSQAYHDWFVAPALMKLREDPAIGSRLGLYAFMPEPQKNSVILVKRIHGKMIMIDGKQILVTTSNFDPRSFKTNSEIGVWLSLERAEAEGLIGKVQTLRQDSDLWGSTEWQVKRDNPLFRGKIILQKWVAKLLDVLNLSSSL